MGLVARLRLREPRDHRLEAAGAVLDRERRQCPVAVPAQRVSQSDFYQSFSTRELRILLLDARAGTPPSALQFILCRGSDPT